MKANNLTVCINADCNKNCRYCVSKMTFAPEVNNAIFYRNLNKAVTMAQLASVNSVMFTSKGEPLKNLEQLLYCLEKFKDFPTEIQTNGLLLDGHLIAKLNTCKLNTLAISIDKFEQLNTLEGISDVCRVMGINLRLTVILSDMWVADPNVFFQTCKKLGVKQLTFRHPTVPTKREDTTLSNNVADWIRQNTTDKHTGFLDYFAQANTIDNLIRVLPFGVRVYDVKGIAITTIDYCLQEFNNTDDIRSLIYHQDGHMYTSWDKQSSLLF